MATTKRITECKIAGLYELERTLGKGHFAVVKLGRHIFTRQPVAVKIIDKTKLDTLAMGHLLQEVRCMKLVQHPNVVRLYEVIDTHTKLYLILELADGGDLYDYILRHEGGVAEHMAKVHFAQIVRAIAYCHRLHVVHRDLKPENVVFFRQQGAVKLTDFGFSNHFQPGTMLVTSCGSLAYSAPEILLGEEYDAPAVDIWSLGVILYMLVCGRPPFQEVNDSETLIMIMDCRYSIPPHVSEECRDLISHMLQRDPLRRAPLQDIESHIWLQDVDTSPSPLSSKDSPSAQEHEVILQAMSSGNIAERDAVQEALEANRYNHITATYYLLRERLLQDKQDNCGSEQHNTQTSDSEPLALVENGMDVGPVALLSPVSPAVPRRGVCESGDLLASKNSRQDPTLRELNSSGSCLALSMRAVASDPPTLLRGLGSLHQICEEEEEEEEAKSIALSAKSSSVAPSSIHISVSEGPCSSNWQDHREADRSRGDLCKSLAQEEELNKEEQERHYTDMLQRADKTSKLHENITHRKPEKLQEEKVQVLIRTEREELHGFTHTACREQKNQPQTSGTTKDSAVHGPGKEIQMPPPGTLKKEGNTGEPTVTVQNQQRAALSENSEKSDENDLQKSIRPPATSKSSGPDADEAPDHKQNQLQKLPSADSNREVSQIHHLENFEEPTDAARDQRDELLNRARDKSGQIRGEGTSDRTSIKDEDQWNELQKEARTASGRRTIELASKCKGQENHTEGHEEEPSRSTSHSTTAHVKNIQSFTHDTVQCCWGNSDPYLNPLEDNNNAPTRSRLPDPRLVLTSCTSPCFSPNNRCVDLCLDTVETRRLMGEATEKTEEHRQNQRGSGDSSADPGKNKNLRERLLQFPLCEKALSLNIQPTSKEKLLPFAQYNCCRVL